MPVRWIGLDGDSLTAMLSTVELETASLPLAIFADDSRLEAPSGYIEGEERVPARDIRVESLGGEKAPP